MSSAITPHVLKPGFKKTAKVGMLGSAGGAVTGAGVGALAGMLLAGYVSDEERPGTALVSAGVGAASGAAVGLLVAAYAYRAGYQAALEGKENG